jgi:hypothetical protein
MKLKTPVYALLFIFQFLSLLAISQEKEEEKVENKFAMGIHAGPTLCTFKTNEPEISRLYTLTARAGFISGIFMQYNLTPRLAGNAELNYELTGYTMVPESASIYIYHPPPGSGPKLLRTKISNYFFSIPLTLKYRVTTGRTAFFINAGGYINMKLKSSKTDFYENYGSGNEKEQRGKTGAYASQANTIQYGAVAGFGLDTRINKHLNFTLEIRDHFALNNIKNEETNAVGLLVGLIFK